MHQPKSHHQPPRSVLVVESDQETGKALCSYLETGGCSVCWERSLQGVQSHSDLGSFAAILLDRVFVDDLLSHLKSVATAVPVIVLSDQSDVKAAVAAMQAGAADYLLKPVDSEQLGFALSQVFAKREAQAAYEREKAFSENLLDLAPTIILVLDREGRIVRFNRFMEELSGYRLDEVKGKDWCDTFLTKEDGPRVRKALEEIVTGGTLSGNTNPIVIRGGEHRQISWRCTDFRDASGEVIGVLATGQDVTELRAAEKKAEDSQRLATIGQTVATFSHETRNELSSMKMALELLPHVLDDEEQAMQVVDHLKHEQEQLVRLLTDVQGFAAPMKLERTNHGLSEIWQKAWGSVVATNKGRNAQLHEHIDAPTVQCYVDGFRLQQVFRNLFENSLASCSDPVQITVACSHTKLGDKDALQILVRDNGPGIPPDQRHEIFRPFVTTKQDGTGLGLALSKRVVEAHHGNIDLGEDDGEGAEFVITIPLADAMDQD